MASFAIFTDSGSDFTNQKVEELNIIQIPLFYSVDDSEPITGDKVNSEQFYADMRSGKKTSTAAYSPETAKEYFIPCLEAGQDIIYLGLSSGISRTADSGRLAAEDLAEQYPDRKIYVIDSLCASLGLGLMVYQVVKMRDEGKTIDEAYEFVMANRLKLAHHFTVDDLKYLRRGGRISAATAIIGSALQIKPIMHVDDEGKLIKLGVARGRKGSLNELAKKTIEGMDPNLPKEVFIVQADCFEDAKYVEKKLIEADPEIKVYIGLQGPVICSHSGPGTLAVFSFTNKTR